MSKIYEELLKDPRWQKIKLEIFQRADWQCEQCRDKTTELHVHHTFYDGRNFGNTLNDSLKCLCKTCHNSEHYKKMRMQRSEEEGLLAKRRCKRILVDECPVVELECKNGGTNFTKISKRGGETDDEFKEKGRSSVEKRRRNGTYLKAALKMMDGMMMEAIPYHLINPEMGNFSTIKRRKILELILIALRFFFPSTSKNLSYGGWCYNFFIPFLSA